MRVALVRRSCRYHRLASPSRLVVLSLSEVAALDLSFGRLFFMNTSSLIINCILELWSTRYRVYSHTKRGRDSTVNDKRPKSERDLLVLEELR
jgi:hypothetical protein